MHVRALGTGLVLGGVFSDVVVVVGSTEAMERLVRGRMTVAMEGGRSLGRSGWAGGVGIAVEGAGAREKDMSWREAHDQQGVERPGEKKEKHDKGREEVGTMSRTEPSEVRHLSDSTAPIQPRGAIHAVRDALASQVHVYARTRGLYFGLEVGGTVFSARDDENARFYGIERIQVDDILRGEVPAAGRWVEDVRELHELLRKIEEEVENEEGVKSPDEHGGQWPHGGGGGNGGGNGFNEAGLGRGGARQDEWVDEDLPKYEDLPQYKDRGDDGAPGPGVEAVKGGYQP